jgi:hypothetical protein
MRTSNVLLVIVLAATGVANAQFVIRPGEYEIAVSLGIPTEAEKAVLDAAGFQGEKRRECITAEDVKETSDIQKFLMKEMEDANCKMSDTKTAGNKLTFTMTCEEDGTRMSWATEMTFGADTFSSVTKGKDHKGRPMTMTMAAKRIGECKK